MVPLAGKLPSARWACFRYLIEAAPNAFDAPVFAVTRIPATSVPDWRDFDSSNRVWRMVWKQWLQHFLLQQAKEQVASRAMDAATPASPPAAETNAVDVAIVIGEKAQTGSLLDCLTDVFRIHAQDFQLYRGNLGERRVLIAQVPGDAITAAGATKALIQAHKPQWVIAAGFSVALRADLRKDALLVASQVIDENGQKLKIDVGSTAPENEIFTVGTVFTCSQVPESKDARMALASRHQADVADTTSMGIAATCATAGIPCLVIRVVRQQLEDQTPTELRHSGEQPSVSGRLGALIGGTFRRPGTARDWYRDQQAALAAADALADFLRGVICRWLSVKPPSKPTG